tara:strand:+ start:1967 stop:2818 length:852 start_codon:yes stop_codon:yes gene_type:complete
MFGALASPTRQVVGLIGGAVFTVFWFKQYVSGSPPMVQVGDGMAFIGRIVFAFILMGTQPIWITLVKTPVNEFLSVIVSAGQFDGLQGQTSTSGAALSLVFIKALAVGLSKPFAQLDELIAKANLGPTDTVWWRLQVNLFITKVIALMIGGMVFIVALLFRVIEAMFFGFAPLIALAWAFTRTEVVAYVALGLYAGGAVLLLLFAALLGGVSQIGNKLVKEAGGGPGPGGSLTPEFNQEDFTKFVDSGQLFDFSMVLISVFFILLFLFTVVMFQVLMSRARRG